MKIVYCIERWLFFLVWAVFPPSLTYYSFFQEDLVIVSGQYLVSFRSFSGCFRVVFDIKMTDWTAQSVIVNR